MTALIDTKLQHEIVVRDPIMRGVTGTDRPYPFGKLPEEWWPRHTIPGPRRPKDTQRGKVYAAEMELRRWMRAEGLEGEQFANIREVTAYCRKIMNQMWFKKRFPCFRKLLVSHNYGGRWCWGGPHAITHRYGREDVVIGFIKMSSWGQGRTESVGGELIVLHELAHAVLPSHAYHHRLWARTFYELVNRYMDKRVGEKMKELYKKHRVKMSPVRLGGSGNPEALAEYRAAASRR